ncbi:MAG: glycosyltransferase family 2 protein [Oligoflexia bacterium]|nr:glycosyltransferase family 2 protein [Oligoflexia bacterium]
MENRLPSAKIATSSSDETVDVIIPVYNGQDYILDSVQSALNQSLPPSNVIVVDDGSTDRTREILLEIAKTNEKLVVITKEHGERNAARNAGLAASKSKYVAFLDADDIWLSNKLEKQIAVFHASNDRELGLVYCDYIPVDLSNNPLESYSGFNLDRSVKGWALPQLVYGNKVCSSASGAVVKRECFEKVGFFDESLSYSEDWEMWARIAAQYKLDYSPEKLVRIRRRPPGPHDAIMDLRFFIGDLKVISSYLSMPLVAIDARKSLLQKFRSNITLKKIVKLTQLGVSDKRLRKVLLLIAKCPTLLTLICAQALNRSHFIFRLKHPALISPKSVLNYGAPEVTVLMPVYNGEKFLKTAIESILKQTFSNFELLIIDNGSTDRSSEIIQAYHDRRIRIIQNDKNIGLIETLNTGIKLARGEYIARLNADDFSSCDRLEQQVDVLRKNKDCVMATCMTETVGEGGMRLSKDKLSFTPESYYFNLHFRNCICHSSVMYRKNAVSEAGEYNRDDLHSRGYSLWCRLSEIGKIIQVQKTLVSRRQASDEIAATKDSEQSEIAFSTTQLRLSSALGKEIDRKTTEAATSAVRIESINSELTEIFAHIFPEICAAIWRNAPAFYRKRKLKKYIQEELVIRRLYLSAFGVKLGKAAIASGPRTWLIGAIQFLYLYGGIEEFAFPIKREHF